jgi:hypothetical protein
LLKSCDALSSDLAFILIGEGFMKGLFCSRGVAYLMMPIESFKDFWEVDFLRGLLRVGGLKRLSIKLEIEFIYLLLLLDFISLLIGF